MDVRISPQAPLTAMLQDWSAGEEGMADRVVPLLYNELKRLASRELRRERPEHTLQVTALVNEAYMRLRDVHNVIWEDRSQFLGFAAHLIRRILVDHARRRGAARRGGGAVRATLAEVDGMVTKQPADLIAVDDALRTLAGIDRRKAAVVELRFFGGLTVEETAATLGISPETVGREWRRAKAWLYQELDARGGERGGC